jgi:hypothetical protein
MPSDYSADMRKSFACNAVSPCRHFWPAQRVCAFYSAIVPRVVAFILGFGSSEWEEMRSAASLHVTEATGDLGLVDVIKTNFSPAQHNLGAWSQRIIRVSHAILSRVPRVAIGGVHAVKTMVARTASALAPSLLTLHERLCLLDEIGQPVYSNEC